MATVTLTGAGPTGEHSGIQGMQRHAGLRLGLSMFLFSLRAIAAIKLI